MKKTIIASLLLITTTTFSQVAQAPQQVKYKIEFTGPDLEVVLKGLSNLPYVESAAIINSIYTQAARQNQPKDTTKKK